MFKQDQFLDQPLEFDNAMFMQVPVSVWCDSRYVDYGGVIENHDAEAVYIDGDYFLKHKFDFKVR